MNLVNFLDSFGLTFTSNAVIVFQEVFNSKHILVEDRYLHYKH